jgi:integrase
MARAADLAAFATGREAGRDLVVVAEPDPPPRHVQAVRIHHEIHGALRPGRAVPIPRFLAVALAAAATGKHADDPVFTMPSGTVVRLSNWRRAVFQPARARASLSARFRVPDLRHTAASLMIQAGYPPKMLQEIMGHASITTTLDRYGHLYPGEMDRYADRLDGAAADVKSRYLGDKIVPVPGRPDC